MTSDVGGGSVVLNGGRQTWRAEALEESVSTPRCDNGGLIVEVRVRVRITRARVGRLGLLRDGERWQAETCGRPSSFLPDVQYRPPATLVK